MRHLVIAIRIRGKSPVSSPRMRKRNVKSRVWKKPGGGNFLDVDTLRELAKSEDPSGAGEFVTVHDFNVLRQTDKDRKVQLDKLESDISTLSDQMVNLLSKFPGSGGIPAATPMVTMPSVTLPVTLPAVTLPSPVVTPVTTTTATSVKTIVTGAALVTSPSTVTSVHATTHWRPPPLGAPPVPSVWSTTTGHPGYLSGGIALIPHPVASIGVPTMGAYAPMSSSSHYSPPTGVVPSPLGMIPAAYLSSPLTPALQSASDLDHRQPGMMYRPEYHVLHEEEGEPIKQVSHKMMTYCKLVHGMVRVAKVIRASGGDIDNYLSHMDYVTRHGKNEDYQDSAYIDYDKMVVDEFIGNPSAGIKVGNVMASSFCFHDVTRVHKPSSQTTLLRKKKKNKPSNRQGEVVPEDYPPENCFYWNYRSCVMTNCNRNHVCRIGGENHRAVNCGHRKQ